MSSLFSSSHLSLLFPRFLLSLTVIPFFYVFLFQFYFIFLFLDPCFLPYLSLSLLLPLTFSPFPIFSPFLPFLPPFAPLHPPLHPSIHPSSSFIILSYFLSFPFVLYSIFLLFLPTPFYSPLLSPSHLFSSSPTVIDGSGGKCATEGKENKLIGGNLNVLL